MLKPTILLTAAAVLSLSTAASANPVDKRFLHTRPVPNGIAAVPEPAAWSLMLVGMFGVGIALRRRTGTSAAESNG